MSKAPYTALILVLAILPLGADATKLYKWVDDNGKVHYSDKMPPDQSNRARARLNDRGIEVERQGPPKTAAERAREAELERLRTEQERILAEQQAKDRVLLRTFRTEDDIALTRDGKIATIDSRIKLTHDRIGRLKVRLADMQARAADRERRGKSIDKKFRDGIEETRTSIEAAYASIVRHEQLKQHIREQYENDIQRFRVLKSIRYDDEDVGPHERVEIDLVETVYSCTNPDSCNLAWQRAQEYAQRHATTKIQVIGERILMTRAPRENRDLSVTVSRILDDQKQEKIFLDVQCRKTALAQEYCASTRVAAIRQGFRAAIAP